MVEVGEDATLNVTVTNGGEGVVDFHIDINEETVVQEEITVEADGTFDTSSAGDISWDAYAGDATVDGNETDNSDDSDDSDSSDGSDGDDDDDTPGFGVGVALVALLGAAMLALRRQN